MATKAKQKRGTVPAVREPLSKERIELTALELIERDGLQSFSTRKLAAELDCEAMSIYHYFPSKGHLMDALVDRVIGSDLTVLSAASQPWRQQLERSGREWRAMALSRPGFFSYLAVHRLNTPTALTWLNGMLAMFESIGLDEETAARMFRATGYYLNGAMLDETAGYSRGPSTVAPVSDEVMRRDYPAVIRAGRWFAPEQREKTFDEGFRILLDGIEREIKRQVPRR